jgi:hypothetical protein
MASAAMRGRGWKLNSQLSISGGDEARRALEQYGDKIEAELAGVVNSMALRVETSAKKRLQMGPKTGRVYQKDSPNRLHQASAPGESPATDTGRLASSVEHRIQKLIAFVFTRVRYGKTLEHGTSKIKPRPWLLPALEENRRWFQNKIREIVRRGA